MKKKIFVFLVYILAALPLPTVVFPQDIYWDEFERDRKVLQSEDEVHANEKTVKEIEIFSRNLAKAATYWQMNAEDIQMLRNKGLGYEELIKVVLISRNTDKPREEIVKRRSRGETFKKICERYGLDYKVISAQAKKILSEVKIYGTK